MRWPWSKPTPPPRIPPYKVPVQAHTPKRDEAIVVEELDPAKVDAEAVEALLRAQSQTGMHKAWKRITGQG
jgi:hypothetical protein